MFQVRLYASGPFRNQSFRSFRRIKFQVSACTLRAHLFRFFLMTIIRFMTIAIAFLSIFALMDFVDLKIQISGTFMDSRARNAARIHSKFLFLRSISCVIQDLFIRFATINVNVSRCISYRFSNGTLRARASARYQCIIYATMLSDCRFAFSAALTRSQTSSSAIRIFRILFGIIINRILAVSGIGINLTIVMDHDL